MIVDDSAMSRRILRDILASDGHEVIEAQDGMAALEVYFLQKPDIVMLDLIMRGMYGLDVLAKLKEMDKEARVIVASADIQSSTRQLAQEAGAVHFVTKPFSRAEIIAAVHGVLEGNHRAAQ